MKKTLTKFLSLFHGHHGRDIGMPAIMKRRLLLPRSFLGVNRYYCFDHAYDIMYYGALRQRTKSSSYLGSSLPNFY